MVDVEYEQGLPARGVPTAFLLSSDTTAAAPKGWHSPPIQFPRHSVIAHEACGPGVPNDGCQCASPQVGGDHMG